MADWPYAGDSPVARARRVAQTYRAHLRQLDPARVDALDRLFTGLGETWVAPRLVQVGLDDRLTAAQAADLGGVSLNTVRVWRLRGRLAGERDRRGAWTYLARDVLALISHPRRRTGRKTPGQSAP